VTVISQVAHSPAHDPTRPPGSPDRAHAKKKEEKVPTIYRETRINAPVDDVWSALGDVGAIDRLIDFLGEVTLDGENRSCELRDGGFMKELIVAVDSELRRVAYSFAESPFDFSHHHASMQALPDGDGTKFVWWTDFQPADNAAGLTEAIDAAVVSIERAFARQDA
jgi:Polyketide cyclase / dehydrase and lipid transport